MSRKSLRGGQAFCKTVCCSPSACGGSVSANTSLWRGNAACVPAARPQLDKVPAILADYDDSESAALGLFGKFCSAASWIRLTRRGASRGHPPVGCTRSRGRAAAGFEPASPLANKLRLLTLTPEQQQLCTANHLSERHACAALRLPEGRRTAALEKMARDKMSVRQADKLVDQMLTAPNAPQPLPPHDPHGAGCEVLCKHAAARGGFDDPEGIAATTHCDKHDGCLEYIVRIPVSSDGTVGKQEDAPKKEDSEFAVKV